MVCIFWVLSSIVSFPPKTRKSFCSKSASWIGGNDKSDKSLRTRCEFLALKTIVKERSHRCNLTLWRIPSWNAVIHRRQILLHDMKYRFLFPGDPLDLIALISCLGQRHPFRHLTLIYGQSETTFAGVSKELKNGFELTDQRQLWVYVFETQELFESFSPNPGLRPSFYSSCVAIGSDVSSCSLTRSESLHNERDYR